jgi:hypothetical protein
MAANLPQPRLRRVARFDLDAFLSLFRSFLFVQQPSSCSLLARQERTPPH